jgi:hypothetical protein
MRHTDLRATLPANDTGLRPSVWGLAGTTADLSSRFYGDHLHVFEFFPRSFRSIKFCLQGAQRVSVVNEHVTVDFHLEKSPIRALPKK